MPALFDASWAAVPGLALRTTLVLMAAGAAQWLLPRHASASLRHLGWMIALIAVLALPLASAFLPTWTLEVRRVVAAAPSPRPADPTLDVSASQPLDDEPNAAHAPEPAFGRTVPAVTSAPASASRWLGAAYLIGLLATLAGVVTQRVRLWRFCRRATPITEGRWLEQLAQCAARLGVRDSVRLLRTGHVVPMTCGTWRPTIVLPADADTWDASRREAVLLHELAHIVRRDCLTQLVASLACASAWYHPGVWWVARRTRQQRELACDDRVVAAGTPARGYAGHLLEIAYAFGQEAAPSPALAMARPRQLESRMRALLDGSRDRRPAGWLTTMVVAASAVLLTLPLAAVSATVVAVPSASVAIDEANPGATSVQVGPADTRESAGLDTNRAARTATRALGVVDASSAAAPVVLQQDAKNAKARGEADEGPDTPGTWEVRPSGNDGMVQLRMTQGRSMNGHTLRVDLFSGLAEAMRTNGTPATFRLTRDAGTFVFDGVFRSGVGAGTFSYVADPKFPDALARRGFARPTVLEQFQMARHDVGFALIDALAAQGYGTPSLATLIKAGQHGVSTTYVTEMGGLGYRLGTVDALITLRDHGVTPSYVRELAALGYKGLPADDVRRARDHGVTPDYVKALADAGHRDLPLDQVIRVRDHGVNAEYVQAMKAYGYGSESIDRLVQARDHGISAAYVKEMGEFGYARLPLDQLIRMRDHGISVGYVRELKELGYEGIAPDDLVRLRDHGLSAERIKRVNSRAGSRLPVAALLEAIRGGRADR